MLVRSCCVELELRLGRLTNAVWVPTCCQCVWEGANLGDQKQARVVLRFANVQALIAMMS